MNLTELECRILRAALYQWYCDPFSQEEAEEGDPLFENEGEYIALLQKLEPEKDQNANVINWRDVAESFYHSCGGANGGCGDLRGIDNLVKYYAKNIEDKECFNCNTEDNLEWLGEDNEACQWSCPECKEVCGYGEDEDDKENEQ